MLVMLPARQARTPDIGGMQLFKYISNDTFRRVRKDDDNLGEELRFEKDAGGKVVRMYHGDNFANKLK